MRGWICFFLYQNFLSPLAWLFLQLGARLKKDEKWREFVQDKNAAEFQGPFSLKELAPRRPFWIHAASGEIEYARPVIRALKEKFPGIPVVVTYTSPSAKKILQTLVEVDAWGPAPWEFSSDVRRFLLRTRPRALLISRTDAWPMMVLQSREFRLPVLLFSATFAANSSRLRGFARPLLGLVLRHLTQVHLVSKEDMLNLGSLLKPLQKNQVRVAGDTRFDQVFHRLAHPREVQQSLRPSGPEPILVAGSTWPEDEAVLLPALQHCPEWKLLLAPHEVGAEKIQALRDQLQSEYQLKSQLYSEGGPWTERVLILDRVGILAELYTWGNLAFVGGSFRKQVHSVMEPLAAGLNVMVGPFHENNREALDFQFSEDVASPAPVRVVRDTQEIVNVLNEEKAQTSDSRALEKRRVQKLLESRRGATHAVTQWCEELVGGPKLSPPAN